MPILSMALYGSRARKDFGENSDTDLFALTNDDSYGMVFNGSINIACYPLDLAQARAAEGDLFFYHIILESVVMYDPLGHLEHLSAVFQKKSSYYEEIKNATDLAVALIHNIDRHKNYFYINKRLAWCLRTVLIAKSAEQGRPVFSAKELGEFSNDRDVEALLAIKKEPGYRPDAYKLMKDKLLRYGSHDSNLVPKERYAQLQYFAEQSNAMGVKTLETILKGEDESSYC